MSLRSLLPGLVGLLFLGLGAPSWAQVPAPQAAPAAAAPLAVFGVYRCGGGSAGAAAGCEPLPEVHRALEKKLQSLAYRLVPLGGPDAAAPPACAPAACAEQLQSACAGGTGRVVGALLQPHKSLTQVRLWMYDLGTGQLAVQDDYCQSCDLSSAVVGQVGTLLDSPAFGPPPAALPAYCAGGSAVSASAPARSSGRVAIVVLGEGRYKAVIRETLKEHLRVLGRRPQLGQGERKQLGIADLHKLLAGDRRGQVLVVELTAQGTELSLFDAATELTQAQSLICESCDKEQFADKLKSAAGALLDHCFGEGCATGAVQSAAPAEACTPFAEPPRAGAAAARPGGGPLVYNLDPRLARVTKGVLWGLFGVSAATALTLFAVNSTSAGTIAIDGARSTNELIRPAYTATGFAALSLGVAIPVTYLLSRAQQKPAGKPDKAPLSSLGCPR